MLKDKPISAPFRVLHPGWFASPERFPLTWAFAWLCVVSALAWLEPLPDELQVRFDWNYLAMMHLCALAGQLVLPFLAWKLLPKDLPGGRAPNLIRLSAGASLWYLWTFPLTFAFTGSLGTLILAFSREFLWAATLAIGVVGLKKTRSKPGLVGFSAVWAILFFTGGVAFALLPDRDSIASLNMANIQTGKIGEGKPPLPATRVDTATWTLSGASDLLDPSRLSLGDRQRIVASGDGWVRVLVADGSTESPQDTTGVSQIDPNDGPELESIVASVPYQVADSQRLGVLHARVHGSIQYTRKFFPGTTSEILRRGTGDCKAYAQVFAAGARRLGYPARVVHGLLASHDGYYAHAWVAVKTAHGWQDWDPTSNDPFPDARYLRFASPKIASGALDGEMAIFALDSISVIAGVGGTF